MKVGELERDVLESIHKFAEDVLQKDDMTQLVLLCEK
jgi:hypothetical protein